MALISPFVLLAVAVAAAVGTAAIEFAWYGFATNVPPMRVLSANLQFGYTIRPAWWVLAAGTAVAAGAFLRGAYKKSGSPPRAAKPTRGAASA